MPLSFKKLVALTLFVTGSLSAHAIERDCNKVEHKNVGPCLRLFLIAKGAWQFVRRS